MPPTVVSLRSAIDAKRRLDELGTARWLEEAATAVHKAQTGGQPIGKLAPEAILIRDGKVVIEPLASAVTAYTAPERLRGGPGDRRSDVFTLGVILWEALAHSRLFEGPEDFVRNAVERGDIPPVSELNANVPHELDAICKKALARDPADRYQSAKVMAAEISSVLEDAGYPDGTDAIAAWAAKELSESPAKPAPMAQTVMGLPPMMKQPAHVNDATMPLTATDIIPLDTKKSDVIPLEVRKSPTTPPPVASTPSSLPSWAQRPGGTQPPPTSTLQGPAIPKSAVAQAAPSILTAPPTPAPEPPRGLQLAEALARAKPESVPPPAMAADPLGPTTKASALEPATSMIATEPGVNKLPSFSATTPGVTGPLVPAPPILPASMTPPTTVPGAAVPPVQSSPVLRLPDTPPGATVTADKPSVFNGSTTAIVGSSISSAVPTATAAKPFSGNQTAVLGSNAIIEAVNAAVSAANPPVPEAPKPVPLVPNPPILPASVVGTPVVKLSEAETINTPALQPSKEVSTLEVKPNAALLAAATPNAVEPPTVPNSKMAELAAKLPPPADDDFAENGSGPSITQRKTTPTPAPSVSTSAASTRARRATSQSDARKSKDVLQGWGWGTDSHTAMEAAISGGDDDFELERKTHRKRMIMIFGGLGAAVVIVIVAAFAFSGGKKTDDSVSQKPNEQLGSAPPLFPQGERIEPAVTEPPKTEPAPQVEPPKVEGAGSAVPTEPPKTEPAKTEPPKTEPAKTEPAKTEPPKVETKKEPVKPEPAKVEPKKPDPPKVEPKKPEPKKPDPVVKKDPPKPPVVDPAKPPKMDAATAYRTGIQQSAKGDLQGALQTFKSSLASDQSYAPTWRGIGIVYEKLGQKARAAQSFRKYLELAPGAPDADLIKARLERLGS